MSGKNWLALSGGIIVGVIAASVYWHNRQESNKFIFDQNVRCQKIAKQYEEEHNFRRGVLKVAYGPTRNSCVAEIIEPHSTGIDFAVEDLISGDRLFWVRSNGTEDMQEKSKEQDAKFDILAR